MVEQVEEQQQEEAEVQEEEEKEQQQAAAAAGGLAPTPPQAGVARRGTPPPQQQQRTVGRHQRQEGVVGGPDYAADPYLVALEAKRGKVEARIQALQVPFLIPSRTHCTALSAPSLHSACRTHVRIDLLSFRAPTLPRLSPNPLKILRQF